MLSIFAIIAIVFVFACLIECEWLAVITGMATGVMFIYILFAHFIELVMLIGLLGAIFTGGLVFTKAAETAAAKLTKGKE